MWTYDARPIDIGVPVSPHVGAREFLRPKGDVYGAAGLISFVNDSN